MVHVSCSVRCVCFHTAVTSVTADLPQPCLRGGIDSSFRPKKWRQASHICPSQQWTCHRCQRLSRPRLRRGRPQRTRLLRRCGDGVTMVGLFFFQRKRCNYYSHDVKQEHLIHRMIQIGSREEIFARRCSCSYIVNAEDGNCVGAPLSMTKELA